MSASRNLCVLVGNLARDPVVRFDADGQARCHLRLATSERSKDGAQSAEWFDAVCFGDLAERAGRELDKGALVYVEGKLHTRSWQSRDGQSRSGTEIVADAVLALGGEPC